MAFPEVSVVLYDTLVKLGFFMACLRVDFTVSDSLFVVWGLDNGDNEHLGSYN